MSSYLFRKSWIFTLLCGGACRIGSTNGIRARRAVEPSATQGRAFLITMILKINTYDEEGKKNMEIRGFCISLKQLSVP
jgi:hypothetical protein